MVSAESADIASRLLVTSKILTRETYVKEWLQLNDVIILPHIQERASDTDIQSDIQSTRTQTHCADALGYIPPPPPPPAPAQSPPAFLLVN